MPATIPAPAASATTEEHADWLETTALASADLNTSQQDLIQAIRRSGSLDAEPGFVGGEDDPRAEVSEMKAQDAFVELENRASACGQTAYPFTIAAQYLQAWRRPERSVYTFLLLLSQFGLSAGPTEIETASLFEAVSATAATAYLGGSRAQHYLFGAPRRQSPRNFRAAIDDLCRHIGEGGGCRIERPRVNDQRDAKLDVVAWRPFRDGRGSQIIAFGQCATGHGWRTKLTELQPPAFCDLWFRDPLIVKPVRMFFVPHRVDSAMWDEVGFHGGILFDRCRIAGHATPLPTVLKEQCLAWSRYVIRNHLR